MGSAVASRGRGGGGGCGVSRVVRGGVVGVGFRRLGLLVGEDAGELVRDRLFHLHALGRAFVDDGVHEILGIDLEQLEREQDQ